MKVFIEFDKEIINPANLEDIIKSITFKNCDIRTINGFLLIYDHGVTSPTIVF